MNKKLRKFLKGSLIYSAIIGVALLFWKKIKHDSKISDETREDEINTVGNIKASTFYEKNVKRCLDIILSFFGIVILSPVFILLSIAIYIDDPGPILFKQKRIGLNKSYFQLYKFRSMKMSTPHDIPTHQLKNPEQYITKIGKFLRKSSLDELPQLFNIFVGDLSVVGPRPALWNQDDLVQERDKYDANNVMPGLTGYAQINGRDELEIPVKAKYDGDYVAALRKSSLSGFVMDAKCFFGTFLSVIKSDGVVEGGTGQLSEDIQKDYYYPDVDTPIGFDDEVEIDFSVCKKVLITGANSYIGESFEKYAKEHYGDNFLIDTIDMIDGSWREKSFAGYDTVFHVAGIAHADVGNVSDEVKKKYYEVNTRLAVETAQKAKDDGVKQFVFMSSMIIYGDSAPYGKKKVISADTKPAPDNFYGDSKWQADKGVRGLASEDYRVLVLRPPMIYGVNSKGNYHTLEKLAKRLPIFPNVDNERSMLYVKNLCEFLCEIILLGKGGVFFPQNSEYTRTADMVLEINRIASRKILLTKALNLPVMFGSRLHGKYGELINKAFGNFCYEAKMSKYNTLNYQLFTLQQSIIDMSKESDKKNIDIKRACIINCFDTYENRVDLLAKLLNEKGIDVTVYTSDYRHIEKCVRTDNKNQYSFIHVIKYKKNFSFTRLFSHLLFSMKVLQEISNINYDLAWVLIPPNSLAYAMSKYKKKNSETLLVFDVIDLWPETMPISIGKKMFPFLLWENVRTKNIQKGDYIVTECELFKEELQKKVKDKSMMTIYLAREIYNLNMAEKVVSPRPLKLCYLGSINNIIDIDAIESIIKKLRQFVEVELHIIGDGEKKDILTNVTKNAGAKVIFHGKIYDNESKMDLLTKCHYGLNIMKKTVMVGLTMKSLDYFEAGLPIINNIQGDTWKFVDDYKIGYNISDDIDYSVISEYDENIRLKVRAFYLKTFGVEQFQAKIEKVLHI